MRDLAPTSLADKMEYYRRELKDKLKTGTDIIPPVYACKTCEDKGVIRYDRDHTHPMFGKLEPCPDCHTQNTTALQDTSGLLPSDYARTWEDIKHLPGHNAYSIAKAVGVILLNGAGWCYLHGGYGLGKTDILKTATARAMQRGMHAIYTKSEHMLDHLRTSYTTGEFEKVYDTYIKVPILCIDEFEKLNHTEWSDVKLFHLLDERWQRAIAGEGVTLLAANVPPEQIREGALVSRIRDERFSVLELKGADVRRVAKSL